MLRGGRGFRSGYWYIDILVYWKLVIKFISKFKDYSVGFVTLLNFSSG
jgi:hypothetical protein